MDTCQAKVFIASGKVRNGPESPDTHTRANFFLFHTHACSGLPPDSDGDGPNGEHIFLIIRK